MHVIHHKLVTDEHRHPIAVQIDYADWLKLKGMLEHTQPKAKKRVSDYAGSIPDLIEDPLAFQKRIRDEWK